VVMTQWFWSTFNAGYN